MARPIPSPLETHAERTRYAETGPAADLGLRRALGRKGLLASAREVERRAERWRPWRGYATLWLWSEDAA